MKNHIEYTRYARVSPTRLLETLAYIAAGGTRKEIARELGVSLSTIYVYSTWAVRLLGAHTLAHACALLAQSDNLALDSNDVDRVRAVMRESETNARRRSK